ncbi:MAG: FHA domain-containing protein, partial [Ignavibacteria bacterium]
MNIYNPQTRIIKAGRSDGNDIIIPNRNVSSYHAQFKIENGTITLEDLNSTNGTFVNGKKILLSKVNSNDVIGFSNNYKFNWNEITKYIPSGTESGQTEDSPEKPAAPEHLSGKVLLYIGRTPENDIVIDNIKVSRKHARLEKTEGEWHIEDLSSSNGTFVNGKKTIRGEILLSDIITVGGIPINLKGSMLFIVGNHTLIYPPQS